MIYVYPIGNNSIVAREKVMDIVVGGGRNCNAAVQALVPALDYRLAESIEVLPAVVSVNVPTLTVFEHSRKQRGSTGASGSCR